MKRILSRPTALLGLLPVLMLCLAPLHARAAGAAAADVANGYAGEAMEKILANWAAPADRGKVRIVVRVDAEGKVEQDFYGRRLAPLKPIGKVCVPSEQEQAENPRSRSAKLRIAEKL